MSVLVRKLAFGSALRLLTLLVGALISFWMMPFIVRSLGDRMSGLWSLLAAVIGYYGLLDLGLASAVTRYLAGAIAVENKDESNRILNTALVLYVALASIVLLVTALVAGLAPVFCSEADAVLFGQVIVILGLQVAISFPLKVFEGFLAARLRYDVLSGTELLTWLLRTLLTVLVLASGYRIVALAVVTLVADLPRGALCVYLSLKNLNGVTIRPSLCDGKTVRQLLSFSSVSFIIQIADLLRFQVDPLVITRALGLAALTHFNVAGMLVRYFVSLMTALMGVLQPLFSRHHDRGEHEEIKKAFLLATKVSVFVSSFVGFGLIMWGKPFIERWMGPDYLDAYPSLALLAASYTFALWQIPSVSLLYGTSKHKFFALANSVEGIANLVLSLVLVGPYGITGVAFGTFLPMMIVKLFIQPVYVCRVMAIPYGEYMQHLGHSLFIAGMALAIPLVLSLRFAAPDYGVLHLLGLTCSLLYAVVWWFSAFNRTERQVIRSVLWRAS